MGARNSVMTGAAGEDFALYQLHIRDLLAAQAPANAYAADIVVFSPTMSVGSMVQVKTRTSSGDGGWHMKPKHETLVHPRLFYVFLDLEPATPTSYLVPSKVVPQAISESHILWLSTPGLRGQAHRDSNMRRITPRFRPAPAEFPDGRMDAYKDRWDLISEDPADAGEPPSIVPTDPF